MEKTGRKRTIIIIIYLVIFFGLGWFVYSLLKPKATCFDGTKNQNEEGVDCGGVCAKKCAVQADAQPLIIQKTGAVPSGIAGKYDFYALVSNPNSVYGSKKFDYEVDFKDASGAVLATRGGSNFILPGEAKYLVDPDISVSGTPATTDIKITDSDWVKLNSYYEEPDIEVVNKTYNQVSGGVGFSQAYGLLKNNSLFDFDLIKIEVILKDQNGNVLGLNSTQMKTVKAGEQRDFTVAWPNSFPGTVSNMEAQAEVNVFDSSTFLKQYYQTEKFQQY
ncbi:MAG: FxLYD domain-containing protein [Candidatus Pacebacteria bacterium]|nr:FxLYD domain-containing protein [Candidatus Paceibacterota bacterium]MDR3583302.1 FxLYD domain-containing protein [Candidatus Paceibacterota bacterium]